MADYWLTSVLIGLRSLPGPYWKEAAARIVNPVSYPRIMEYGLIHESLGALSGKRVLDIGSPKLPAILIARAGDAELHATDIRDYFIGPTRHFISRCGMQDRLGRHLHLDVEDARNLSYPGAYFDAVYSISVIEHVPGAGDSEAMREIARVLKPGGLAAITVPFSPAGYREDWVPSDVYERSFEGQEVFYQRHYDAAALTQRLIEPSGLAVARLQYFGEPGWRFEPCWNRIPMRWKLPLLWAQPFIATAFLKRLRPEQVDRACGVLLTLRKPDNAASRSANDATEAPLEMTQSLPMGHGLS